MGAAEPGSASGLSGPMIAFMIGVAIVVPIAGLAFGAIVIARGDTRIGAVMIVVSIASAIGYVFWLL